MLLTGNGSSWTNSSLFTVGRQGIGGRLRILNNASLTAGDLDISSQTNSRGNLVEVLDSGRLIVLDTLTVGFDGNASRLVISNGAVVANAAGIIGARTTSVSNEVIVTGAGSLWTNSGNLTLGHLFEPGGSANRLLITEGARVVSRFGHVGAGSTGGTNLAIVTGSNSTWSNALNMIVGHTTDANRLVVSNGGIVISLQGVIGQISGSQNNEALITGPGSRWIMSSDMTIGPAGAGNRLIVTNGGFVAVGSNLFLGNSFSAAGTNRVVVHGGTLLVTNPAAIYAVRGGTNQLNSGLIDAGQLWMTNSQATFEFNGGLLVTRGAFISNNTPFSIGRTGVTPAIWDMRAGPINHFIAGSILIGSNSSFNQLLITNGTTLTNRGNGFFGFTSGSRSNTAILSGPGSRWLIETDLHLGSTGAVNRLVVSNGAVLACELAPIGLDPSSSNNEAVVTGPGSLWQNFLTVVGSRSAGNRFTVSNAATVLLNGLTLGATPTATNNRIVIQGGSVTITNVISTSLCDLRRGTNVLNAGLMQVDRLFLTNALSRFEFNGGALVTKNTTNTNSRVFVVGNGNTSATLQLAGSGSHFFDTGLTISSNAILSGNGTIFGIVTVQTGGTLSPGQSIGNSLPQQWSGVPGANRPGHQ